MAINNPIIASQGTRTREQARTVVFKVTGTAPPEPRFYVPEPGSGDTGYDDQSPQREGQVLLHQTSPRQPVTFYVVVNINGVLTWKKASIGVEFFDYRTGQQWDPLAGAYSYLVPYEP